VKLPKISVKFNQEKNELCDYEDYKEPKNGVEVCQCQCLHGMENLPLHAESPFL